MIKWQFQKEGRDWKEKLEAWMDIFGDDKSLNFNVET